MTSARKKKKQKVDTKEAGQLRNWLTKHKKPECGHPVSFKVFSQVVENLPDIAFEVQIHEVGFHNKTLDECANWYYNAFYTDPSVRTKYEYQLRSCPLKVKEKLLSLPGGASTSSDNNEGPQGQEEVEVTVVDCGRFRFPVSFATFEKYFDSSKLMKTLVHHKTKDKSKRKAMLADDKTRRTLLRTYYNAFYVFPSKRRLHKYNFKDVPASLSSQLLKIATPLDEMAKKTMAQSTSESPPGAVHSESEQQSDPEKNLISVASFPIFEKYVKNLYDIVWRLKLNEPDYGSMGFEDCAYAYYLDFYLNPEIRQKYSPELRPCEPSLQERILAIPSQSDVATLQQLRVENGNLPTTQDLEPKLKNAATDCTVECDSVPKTVEVAETTPNSPSRVSFTLFKRYVKNMDGIVQKMLSCEEYCTKSEDECALQYFKEFYRNPQIRERFPYQLRPCPARIRDKLLKLPDESVKEYQAKEDTNNLDKVDDGKLITVKGITYKYPVSFETFKRYINLKELMPQLIRRWSKQRGEIPSEKRLLKSFYHTFYLEKKLRKQFKYNFDSAPDMLRDKLIQMAEPLDDNTQPEVDMACVASKNQDHKAAEALSLQCSDKDGLSHCVTDVVVDLQNVGRFILPVSFDTFKEYINYEELIKPLLMRVVQDKSQLSALAENPHNPQCLNVLRRYYHSFYVRPINTRSLYQFRFKNVSEKLLEKLMAFAVPLDEAAKKVMEEDANVKSVVTEQPQKPALQEFPVSLELFRKYIKNLDSIVDQMLRCAEYKDMSASECALTYYKAFYTDAEMRQKFKYQLKPCPGNLRNKLLSYVVPKETESETTKPTEIGLDVAEAGENKSLVINEKILINLQGTTYEFPVSLQTFKRYINYDTIKHELAEICSKNIQTVEKMLSDEQNNFVLLQRFYHMFYMDRNVREICNFNFDAAPRTLLPKLLQFAVPVEKVATRYPSKTKEANDEPKDSNVAAVEKTYFKDVQDTATMSQELCPRNVGRVVSPDEICVTSKTQDCQTAGGLSVQSSDQDELSNCVMDVVVELRNVGRFLLPVSFETFKQYINYDELIKPLLMRVTQDESQLIAFAVNPLHEQCLKIFRRYYHSFYVRPINTRSLYEYRFENASVKLREKLMLFAVPLNEAAKKVMEEDANIKSVVPEQPQKQTSDAEMDAFPVSLDMFKKYVKNIDSIVEQMLRCTEYKDMSASECALMYYKSFYKDAEIRKKFEYELKPCPAQLRNKLLSYAVPKETEPETTKPKEPGPDMTEADENQAVVINEKILINLQGTTYEFPVSLQTFQNYINYDEIKQELAKYFSKNVQTIEKMLSDEQNNMTLLRRFYHTFYIDRNVRDFCNFNFKNAPLSLLPKLLQFAVPVEEVSMLPSVAKVVSIEEMSQVQPEPQQSHATFSYPVSFSIFSNLLDLDGVVQQMQQEPQYAVLSEKQCQQAYYEAFYRTPEIRNKYLFSMRACPSILKAKLLLIPPSATSVTNASNVSRSSPKSRCVENITALFAERKAELEKLKKINVINYVPHNLGQYIALRTQCPSKRALLEKHFIVKKVRKETNEDCEGSAAQVAARRETATATATQEVANKVVQDSNESVTVVDKTSSQKASVQDTAKISNETTGAKIVSEKSSLTPTNVQKRTSPSKTAVSRDAQSEKSKQSEQSATVVPSQSTKSKTDETTTETRETNSIDATNQATAKVFFTESSKEHNMKYLLYTSHGLRKIMWRILAQLSYSEFNTYTSIYEFVKDENLLLRFYEHVIQKGNWPVNLYVKLPLLRHLLHSKGIQLDTLDLAQISPKILHWHELIRFSNFDEIVENEYYRRTGNVLDDLQHLFKELDQFYSACWQRDQWIYEVPKIQADKKSGVINWNDTTTDVSESVAEPILPPCLMADQVQESAKNVTTENNSIDAESDCPATQLNLSLCPASFVDIDNVCPASQAVDSVDDPLMTQTIVIPGESENIVDISNQINDSIDDHQEIESSSTRLKEEQIIFPNMLRFDLINSADESYHCEPIQTEEQIINLDGEDELQPALVKEEPIKFLDMMRFALNSSSSDGYQCEKIPSEEQIINVDNEDEERVSADLACFVLPKPNDILPTPVLDATKQSAALEDKFHDILDELIDLSDEITPSRIQLTPEEIASQPIGVQRKEELIELCDELLNPPQNELVAGEADRQKITSGPIQVEQQQVTPDNSSAVPAAAQPKTTRPQAIIVKLPFKNASKRPRLMADNVPQLRHEFRPLPLHSMVRIETELPTQPERPSDSSQQAPLTVSQELAADNTLMASSQLERLLDAPNVTQRKVNQDEEIVIDSDKTDSSAAASASSTMLHTHIVFRSLQRYMYFDSLTTAQISKYQINSISVGSSYQQALINANGKLCNVYGPLLENLFPHCTTTLMQDLQFLLSNLGEFNYNSNRHLNKNSKEDLRLRVLDVFMRTAPAFGHIHLRFENESRAWATCSSINECDTDFLIRRKPNCDVRSHIRPEILDRMRELKSSYF